MAEVHYYNPWTFCGLEQDETWGRKAYYWGVFMVSGSDRNALSGDETEMQVLVRKMKTKFVDKGIPVILGIWCHHHSHRPGCKSGSTRQVAQPLRRNGNP